MYRSHIPHHITGYTENQQQHCTPVDSLLLLKIPKAWVEYSYIMSPTRLSHTAITSGMNNALEIRICMPTYIYTNRGKFYRPTLEETRLHKHQDTGPPILRERQRLTKIPQKVTALCKDNVRYNRSKIYIYIYIICCC